MSTVQQTINDVTICRATNIFGIRCYVVVTSLFNVHIVWIKDGKWEVFDLNNKMTIRRMS